MRYLVLLLILCACSTPVAQVKPVPVQEEIAVSCITEVIPEPQWNASQITAQTPLLDKVKATLEDLELSKAYIAQLQAQMKACI